MLDDFIIRPIQPGDNAALASIIRGALEEFGANRLGTVYFDASTDHLYELFSSTPGSAYLVAEKQGQVLGGGGIFPTEGLPSNTCELVKMYLHRDSRGIGLGRKLMNECLHLAARHGYTQVYLETMPELAKAVTVYRQFGFKDLCAPLGNSGHTGCGMWMLRSIES